jgi:hypothetical protein
LIVQTVRWAPWLYGADEPPLDDPAEAFHEASKVYPSTAGGDGRGVALLESSEAMRRSAGRSVRRWNQVAPIPLPAAALPRVPLLQALRGRGSERTFSEAPLTLDELAALLWAA